MDIAIVGATGNVGRKTLEVLQQKNLNIDNLYLVASPNSVGKQLEFNGKKYSIENLETYDFSKAKITFFAAGGKISKQYAEKAAKHTTVIDNSSYKEELKMTNETKKILDARIELSATCVRIPVLVSHSESVNIEFEQEFSLEKIKDVLNNAPGCSVIDKRENGGYVTPIEATGKNETFVSRIREDKTKKNCLNLWIVSDNLLRGAALNSVEIAEVIINNN